MNNNVTDFNIGIGGTSITPKSREISTTTSNINQHRYQNSILLDKDFVSLPPKKTPNSFQSPRAKFIKTQVASLGTGDDHQYGSNNFEVSVPVSREPLKNDNEGVNVAENTLQSTMYETTTRVISYSEGIKHQQDQKVEFKGSLYPQRHTHASISQHLDRQTDANSRSTETRKCNLDSILTVSPKLPADKVRSVMLENVKKHGNPLKDFDLDAKNNLEQDHPESSISTNSMYAPNLTSPRHPDTVSRYTATSVARAARAMLDETEPPPCSTLNLSICTPPPTQHKPHEDMSLDKGAYNHNYEQIKGLVGSFSGNSPRKGMSGDALFTSKKIRNEGKKTRKIPEKTSKSHANIAAHPTVSSHELAPSEIRDGNRGECVSSSSGVPKKAYIKNYSYIQPQYAQKALLQAQKSISATQSMLDTSSKYAVTSVYNANVSMHSNVSSYMDQFSNVHGMGRTTALFDDDSSSSTLPNTNMNATLSPRVTHNHHHPLVDERMHTHGPDLPHSQAQQQNTFMHGSTDSNINLGTVTLGSNLDAGDSVMSVPLTGHALHVHVGDAPYHSHHIGHQQHPSRTLTGEEATSPTTGSKIIREYLCTTTGVSRHNIRTEMAFSEGELGDYHSRSKRSSPSAKKSPSHLHSTSPNESHLDGYVCPSGIGLNDHDLNRHCIPALASRALVPASKTSKSGKQMHSKTAKANADIIYQQARVQLIDEPLTARYSILGLAETSTNAVSLVPAEHPMNEFYGTVGQFLQCYGDDSSGGLSDGERTELLASNAVTKVGVDKNAKDELKQYNSEKKCHYEYIYYYHKTDCSRVTNQLVIKENQHIAYRYQMHELLGGGAFSRVYRASDHYHDPKHEPYHRHLENRSVSLPSVSATFKMENAKGNCNYTHGSHSLENAREMRTYQNIVGGKPVAIKISANTPQSRLQAQHEVSVLLALQTRESKSNAASLNNNIMLCLNSVLYRNHPCIISPLYSINLREYLYLIVQLNKKYISDCYAKLRWQQQQRASVHYRLKTLYNQQKKNMSMHLNHAACGNSMDAGSGSGMGMPQDREPEGCGMIHANATLITLKQIKYICKQLLVALAHMNSCQVIHGDIKMENVCLKYNSTVEYLLHNFSGKYTEPGDGSELSGSLAENRNVEGLLLDVVLVDFGCSSFEVSPEADGTEKTKQKSYVQSRNYRAPEVIVNGGVLPYDSGIDIWGLAILLMELYVCSDGQEGRDGSNTDPANPALFPGVNELHQLLLYSEILDLPTPHVDAEDDFDESIVEESIASVSGSLASNPSKSCGTHHPTKIPMYMIENCPKEKFSLFFNRVNTVLDGPVSAVATSGSPVIIDNSMGTLALNVEKDQVSNAVEQGAAASCTSMNENHTSGDSTAVSYEQELVTSYIREAVELVESKTAGNTQNTLGVHPEPVVDSNVLLPLSDDLDEQVLEFDENPNPTGPLEPNMRLQACTDQSMEGTVIKLKPLVTYTNPYLHAHSSNTDQEVKKYTLQYHHLSAFLNEKRNHSIKHICKQHENRVSNEVYPNEYAVTSNSTVNKSNLHSNSNLNPNKKKAPHDYCLFISFIKNCFQWDPKCRINAKVGLHHPWLSESNKIKDSQYNSVSDMNFSDDI